MRRTIELASDIGGVIRAARKIQKLRQDDAAGSVGVSESFMAKAERGTDTVQWGKVFQILQGLGVRVVVEIPNADDELLTRQAALARFRSSVRALHGALRANAAKGGIGAAGARTQDWLIEPPTGQKVLLRAAERLAASVETDEASAELRALARKLLDDAELLSDSAKPTIGPKGQKRDD
jgi:transcriptional regulator with XRE-family HTH domain